MAGDRPSQSTTNESPSEISLRMERERMRVFDPTTGEEIFRHPETGELLTTEDEWLAAIVRVEEMLAPIYRVRRNIREAYAERFPVAAQPVHRRNRTDTQEKVARCPRCGSKIPKEES